MGSITKYFGILINTNNNTNKNAGSGIIVGSLGGTDFEDIRIYKEFIVIMGL